MVDCARSQTYRTCRSRTKWTLQRECFGRSAAGQKDAHSNHTVQNSFLNPNTSAILLRNIVRWEQEQSWNFRARNLPKRWAKQAAMKTTLPAYKKDLKSNDSRNPENVKCPYTNRWTYKSPQACCKPNNCESFDCCEHCKSLREMPWQLECLH
eukprot:TRINITY_DN6994_c0_g2_i6.p1 TRINITY_DN6994_c0_g2~~TRINITY_DN6994_c0_g2_i6.p1  ORF type:complete len:153 (-),score=17.27 TRINITY_DN6994_c0_g2_i6:533-991(-)